MYNAANKKENITHEALCMTHPSANEIPYFPLTITAQTDALSTRLGFQQYIFVILIISKCLHLHCTKSHNKIENRTYTDYE